MQRFSSELKFFELYSLNLRAGFWRLPLRAKYCSLSKRVILMRNWVGNSENADWIKIWNYKNFFLKSISCLYHSSRSYLLRKSQQLFRVTDQHWNKYLWSFRHNRIWFLHSSVHLKNKPIPMYSHYRCQRTAFPFFQKTFS